MNFVGVIVNRSNSTILLVSIFFFASNSLLTSPVIILEDSQFNLASEIEVFETKQDLTFAEVLNDSTFHKNTEPVIHRGYSSNHFWFRFSVKNKMPGQFWFTTFSANQLDIVDFYIPNMQEPNGYEKLLAGDHRPFSQWSQPYPSPTFKFYLKQNQQASYYAHVKSNSVISFNVTLADSMAFAQNQAYKNVQIWIMFGIILFFIIFVVYFSYRSENKNYLYLIPLTILHFLYKFFITGNSYQFWPNYPDIQDKSLALTLVLFLLLMTWFTRLFLQLASRQPIMDKLFLLSWLIGLSGLYFLFEVNIFMLKCLSIYGLWTVLLVLWTLIKAELKGQKYVRYLLLVWMLIGAGGFIRALTLLKILPYNLLTYDASIIQYPVALLLLLKSMYNKYNGLLIENKELGSKYNELMQRLRPATARKTRIAGLDVALIVNKIEMMVNDDALIYNHNQSLQMMAENLAIRQDQLSEILNKELNTSFRKFINTIRVHKACRLMELYPDKNITEIFLDSGFASKSPFNKAFNEIMETSPSLYRNSLKNR